MDKNKLLAKLEQDLSYFMIGEACKNNPEKRGSPEMYKYKGLSIETNENSKDFDKIASIRIGSLEAHFKIETGDKVFGNLAPDDERFVRLWMCKSENIQQFKQIFYASMSVKPILPIIPFDLETFYIS